MPDERSKFLKALVVTRRLAAIGLFSMVMELEESVASPEASLPRISERSRSFFTSLGSISLETAVADPSETMPKIPHIKS